MKATRTKCHKGEVVTAIVLIIGSLALGISTTKVGQYAIDRHNTSQIAQDLKEQSQHLSGQAAKMGKSGDEAVKESLRLNEAAKDIEKHGLQVYSEKALGEGLNLGAGAMVGQIGTVGNIVSAAMDLDGVLHSASEAVKGAPPSEDEIKLQQIIRGSKTNMDDFELAQEKAAIDEIAKMKGELKEASDYLEQMIKLHEQNEAEEARREELRKKEVEARTRERLAAIQKEEIKKEYEASLGKSNLTALKAIGEILKNLSQGKKPDAKSGVSISILKKKEVTAAGSLSEGNYFKMITGLVKGLGAYAQQTIGQGFDINYSTSEKLINLTFNRQEKVFNGTYSYKYTGSAAGAGGSSTTNGQESGTIQGTYNDDGSFQGTYKGESKNAGGVGAYSYSTSGKIGGKITGKKVEGWLGPPSYEGMGGNGAQMGQALEKAAAGKGMSIKDLSLFTFEATLEDEL